MNLQKKRFCGRVEKKKKEGGVFYEKIKKFKIM